MPNRGRSRIRLRCRTGAFAIIRTLLPAAFDDSAGSGPRQGLILQQSASPITLHAPRRQASQAMVVARRKTPAFRWRRVSLKLLVAAPPPTSSLHWVACSFRVFPGLSQRFPFGDITARSLEPIGINANSGRLGNERENLRLRRFLPRMQRLIRTQQDKSQFQFGRIE